MFFIVHQDKPIYQVIFNQSQKQLKELFLVHSTLDSIEQKLNKRFDYYLGHIKTDNIPIFCYVNSLNLKFILALNQKKQIDRKSEGNIKDFFNKVNQQLAMVLMNPLYKVKDQINSQLFDEKVKLHIKEHIRNQITQKKKI